MKTNYNGINFRSRLEAKWHQFFKELNWNTEYEPIDTKFWIPDFQIVGAKESILVEVKPISHFDLETAIKIYENRIVSNVSNHLLLLGNTIPNLEEEEKCPTLGWFMHKDTEWNKKSTWPLAEFVVILDKEMKKKHSDFLIGFGCLETEIKEYIYNYVDFDMGCKPLSFFNNEFFEDKPGSKKFRALIEHLWKKAANDVQWKKN